MPNDVHQVKVQTHRSTFENHWFYIHGAMMVIFQQLFRRSEKESGWMHKPRFRKLCVRLFEDADRDQNGAVDSTELCANFKKLPEAVYILRAVYIKRGLDTGAPVLGPLVY